MEEEQDDVTLEEEAGETADVDLRERVKKLREKLKVCLEAKQEYLTMSQRLRADYVNLKRESQNEKEELGKFVKTEILLDFLDVADLFEMAFADKAAWDNLPEGWRRGMEGIHSKFVATFRRHGLEEINPDGLAFDPAEHQAVGVEQTNVDSDDNIVKTVVQKGYKLHGKIIRPAKIKIWQKS